MMINFKSINDFHSGQIQELIKICYRDLIKFFPAEKQRFYQLWESEDRQAFQNIDTIGRKVMFTCLDNNPIGYFSWDDRQFPIGIIGQNCILPLHQRQGYGKSQIEMIKKLFKDKNFETIIATTGDHEFFKPAQKMYLGCGFKLQSKRKGDLFELIEYIGDLND